MLFAFYATGVLVFAYLAVFHITETQYFVGEDDVVVPKHVLEEQVEHRTFGDEIQISSLGGEGNINSGETKIID